MGIPELRNASENGVLLIGGETSSYMGKRIMQNETVTGLAKDYHNFVIKLYHE
jgi:hypothetical protein